MQGVRHLVHQRLGKTQMPPTPRRRIPPGQRDLMSQTTSAPRRGHTGLRFSGTTRRLQSGRRPSLTRRSRRLDPLQLSDALNQRRLASRRIDCHQRFEHTLRS